MNHHTNIMRLKAVAAALSTLEDEIVFVGGATISLYVPQPELTTIRVTDDVDVVLELISTGDFYRLQEKLISLGFRHDKNAVGCSHINLRFFYTLFPCLENGSLSRAG
jgi:hypothetical protein